MSLNIPGGKVEKNEKLVDAANREWSEEIMGIPNYTFYGEKMFNETHFKFKKTDGSVSYTHLTLPTTPYV